MGSFKNYALAGILALAASTTAHAADLPAPPPPMPYAPVEVGGGWYLRGDIGMTNQEVDRLSFVSANGQAVPANLNDGNFHTDFVEFDSSVFGGIGVGYQFNPWLRVDVTGEYRGGASFHGFERSIATPTDIDKYTAIKSEWVGLLNAYFDLGTWYGVTPFVGAGVGFTRTKISSFVDTFVGAGGGIGGGFAPDDHSETDFAWALHAGVAYDVTPNFKVEFAYRYLNLGDGQTGVLTSFDSATTGRVAVKMKDLDSHDFKVGLRWMLGAPVLAAAVPAAPVMRRF